MHREGSRLAHQMDNNKQLEMSSPARLIDMVVYPMRWHDLFVSQNHVEEACQYLKLLERQ